MVRPLDIPVLDMAVRWNLRWANRPTLAMVVDRMDVENNYSIPGVPRWSEREFVRVPGKQGTFYIWRMEPCVSFIFESEYGGGALDDSFLVDGARYKPNGGWSSSESTINRMRLEQEFVRSLLPFPVVDVTYHIDSWGNIGMAGMYFDYPWVLEQIERFLPDVGMYPLAAPADEQASSEQALVIHSGSLRASEWQGSMYVPYPKDTPGEKPDEESGLYHETDALLRVHRARG